MAGKLAGKTALVSGVNNGIGGEIARLFGREGANIACTGILMDEVEAAAAGITAAGGRALARRLDVTSDADWRDAVDAVVTEFGSLDILVTNAGVLLLASLAETTPEEFRRVQRVNTEGAFLGMRHAVPAMGRGGCIINIASVAAFGAAENHIAYGTSKAALSGMTRHAAAELASSGIRVNAICPGVVRTGMLVETPDNIRRCTEAHPLGLGESSDVAAAALYLAADDARWVTGTELTVDGGLSIRP